MGRIQITFSRLTKVAIATAALGLSAVPASAKSLTGVWIDDKGRGAIEIVPCGSKFCGRVVWTRSEEDSRRGCGKQLIGGVSKLGASTYGGGWIYSPERRKTFDVELRPLKNGNLRVTGFAGIRLFSKTMIWTPAPDDIERCDKSPTPSNEVITAEKTTPPADERTADKPAKADTRTAKADVETTEKASPVVPETKTSAIKENELPKKQETAKSEADPVDRPEPSDDVAEGDDEQRQDEPEVASMEDAGPPAPREKGLDLDKLNLGDVFKRTKSGRCKLDLPWVKVQFECDD